MHYRYDVLEAAPQDVTPIRWGRGLLASGALAAMLALAVCHEPYKAPARGFPDSRPETLKDATVVKTCMAQPGASVIRWKGDLYFRIGDDFTKLDAATSVDKVCWG